MPDTTELPVKTDVRFAPCPVCGNVIHSIGEAVVHCHGILLQPEEAEGTNEDHKIFIERVEDEYYVQIEHEMTKKHYISFIAAVSSDRLQMVKLYPEGAAQARFKLNGIKKDIFLLQQKRIVFNYSGEGN